MPLFGCCIRKVVDVKSLDYRHSGLSNVPNAVFNAVHTIETLHIDSNQIKTLPRELFHCHGLRDLTLSDNEITSFPPAISALTNLEKLDVSKNGISELPENLKTLKYLSVLDASVNPLGKLPDGFTQLLNLTQVCLNDCFLEYLPGNFGRLSNLKILELRENHLKTLPQSLSRLTELERLDVGCNEFTELPGSVVGTLLNLLELWCDSNQITSVPKEIGNLKQLMYFDACKNRVAELPDEIDGCISLSDLHLSTNLLKTLPHSIGRLSNITTLKVDDNQLVSLPSSIGGLVSLSELDVSANDLEEIPPTIGLLRHLRTLIADENFLSDIPCELGSCSGLTVLSVRSNKLTYLPDEIGRIPRLRVLNLSDNEIKVLPYSLMNLKELQALWLAENQSKALIRLQSAIDPETQRRCLVCYLLPQQRLDPIDSYGDDNQSFHPSMWEEQRQQRTQIHFQDSNTPNDTAHDGSAYPKEMRVMTRHVQNEAIRKITSVEPTKDENEPTENGLLLGSDTEPKNSTHRLVKLEKEKLAKDRARINRLSQEINPEDVKLSMSGGSLKSEHKKQSNKSKERRNSKGSERDVEHSSHHTPTSAKRLNGSLKNITQPYDPSSTPQNKPRTIQNGHYNATPARVAAEQQRHHAEVQRSSSGRSAGIPHSQTFPVNNQTNNQVTLGSQQSLRGQPHDRYLTNLQNNDITDSHHRIDNSRRSENGGRGSATRLSSGQNSQQILTQEDTFGIFASDEDPKLYQRRFKYYQRMRKHRKNPEVRSDLGYYNDQYGSGSVKNGGSESGRSHRRPLQQGRDGFDQWERYSQRSVGDGYASDVEGFNYAGKKPHHVSNHMQSPYRPTPQKTFNTSRSSVGEHRPAVPPSYHTAMAKRTDTSKQVENTAFPPPPPYKPPARDPGPDGASNDGVPRSSPTHEEGMPFTSYSEAEKLQRATVINVNDSLPKQQDQHITSTPLTHNGNRPNSLSTPNNNINQTRTENLRNSMPSSYYSPVDAYSERTAQVRRTGSNPKRQDSQNNQQQYKPQVQQRSSFYDSNYQDDAPVDTEYAAQISKSLGRLGYNRESDKRLARPPPQFSGDPNDTVPPPPLFSSSQSEAAKSNELYGSKNGHGMNTSSNYATPNSYTPSAQRRTYQPPTTPTSSRHNLSNGHIANQSNYSYLPPPTRKSPKLPHKQMMPPSGIELEPASSNTKLMNMTIIKNPGLGFSVAGGVGLQGNPYKPHDEGIFVTKLHTNGAATNILQPGDKILSVNGQDFTHMEHNSAVNILKQQPTRVDMVIERMLPTDV